MSNLIPVLMPDGSTDQVPIDSFVNAANAVAEAQIKFPLYKAQPALVIIRPDELVRVDGTHMLKKSARERIANQAGVQQFGATVVEDFDRDGATWTRYTVRLVRPPIVTTPREGIAEGAISEANQRERKFFHAKLHTQAYTRALKRVLGDSFNYDPREVESKGGRFVVASIQPDMDDPDVRQVQLERMRQSEGLLYSQPTTTSAPVPSLPGESVTLLPPGHAPDLPDDFDAAEIADTRDDVPDWARGYAFDPVSGAIDWESKPSDDLEADIRAALKADTTYDMGDDPYDVVKHCKAGDWIRAARALLAYQMTDGGADDA